MPLKNNAEAAVVPIRSGSFSLICYLLSRVSPKPIIWG